MTLRTTKASRPLRAIVTIRMAAVLAVSLNVAVNFTGNTACAADAGVNKTGATQPAVTPGYRGPVDLIVGGTGSGGAGSGQKQWVATINELSSSVTLVDVASGQVVDELQLGGKPVAAAKIGESEFLVSCQFSGKLHRIAVEAMRLKEVASIQVGFEPFGVAASATTAYVGLQATDEIAQIDLATNRVARKFNVGKWPRQLALTHDGSRLAAGLAGESHIAIVDTESGETLYSEPISGGINIGRMKVSSHDGQVYFPWMIYRTNPITVGDIRKGWVLASRVARVRTDGPAYREAISLDVPGMAVADPYGIAIMPEQNRMVVTSSGTHELLVYRLADLPFIAEGGPGDLIDQALERDRQRFYRIPLGGRPMGTEPVGDGKSVFVVNHLLDAIQIVDLSSRKITRTITIGGVPAEESPEQESLMQQHRGMAVFYDATRSLDQWYSCQSCHVDGGTNSRPMDTWNDGTKLTTKTVLPLQGVTDTAPWTWHGWQTDLDESLQNSFTSTMQGKPASQADIAALRAYLSTLEFPPNPFRNGDGSLTAAARRGEVLFQSADVGCADCHSGPRFTDGEIHDVGMTRDSDAYQGYNTPSLVGVYRKPRLLHDGRAKTLEAVLTKWHRPEEIGGGAELSASELDDLIAYLRAL